MNMADSFDCSGKRQIWQQASFAFALLTFFIGSCVSSKQEIPKTVTLQNEYLKVVAKTTGAELISIKLLKDNTEYLWQGDSITWSDHAIVQFPVIGNLKDDTYQLDSVAYEMMSHGFARISQFEIIEQSKEKAVFQLKSNSSTLGRYPYEFAFRVSYELEGNSINIRFGVLNKDEQEMYFSLGYHPGFNCPLRVGENMEDYYLEFSNKESADRLMLEDNLIDGLVEDYMADTSKIYLSKDIFQEDAIILKDITSSSVSLKNTRNKKSVTLSFGEVPYLGIWSPKRFGDFVCIEPWFGLADVRGTSGNFKEKLGIVQLNQKESFDWDCTVTIN